VSSPRGREGWDERKWPRRRGRHPKRGVLLGVDLLHAQHESGADRAVGSGMGWPATWEGFGTTTSFRSGCRGMIGGGRTREARACRACRHAAGVRAGEGGAAGSVQDLVRWGRKGIGVRAELKRKITLFL
jgi:hypothetical protein